MESSKPIPIVLSIKGISQLKIDELNMLIAAAKERKRQLLDRSDDRERRPQRSARTGNYVFPSTL
jgi:hypothetical protein